MLLKLAFTKQNTIQLLVTFKITSNEPLSNWSFEMGIFWQTNNADSNTIVLRNLSVDRDVMKPLLLVNLTLSQIVYSSQHCFLNEGYYALIH